MTDANGRLTSYDEGAGVTIVFSFLDRDGAPVDPGTIVVEVQRQGASALWATWTFGELDAPIVRDGLGQYHADVLPDAGGYWAWEAKGDGIPNTEPLVRRGLFLVVAGEPA